MQLSYDEGADAVYVYFRREDVARTDKLADNVLVDYDGQGEPVGVEFLDVSDGIELDEVPHREEVARLLEDHNFPVYA